ncbi:MlaD family protein [Henriciella litoralis]|uniref:MlaD family protein n=1 Tax=Henriciella litoralis TaxID=568102 RepID=UPI000A06EB2E|nr:MlaD family protein [Henriciella litoralis]
MRESIFETLIGAAVLVVAGVFLWFAMARGGEAASSPSGSVELGARFNSASGIDRGTDVRMAGVKVGTVRAIKLDVDRAEALVTFAVSKDLVPLDDGTSARIQSEGLLGGSYINLEPAAGFGQIEPCGEGQQLFGDSGCGEILYTQGSVDLLTLLASFASGNGGGDDSSSNDSSSSSSNSADSNSDDDASPFGDLTGSDDEADSADKTDENAAEDEAATESPDSSTSLGEAYPDTPGDNR